jgi:hypothetical protein
MPRWALAQKLWRSAIHLQFSVQKLHLIATADAREIPEMGRIDNRVAGEIPSPTVS